ncbi:hypothetical protein H7E67_16820 [Clostridium gasigenes]|uniref:hypothetical protein n=1 Tax=Clostridium gasigenes TaxID=94869 RepID=UPI00162AB879|nr:hypothetical protein [Clostridium gasigenes]MBB6625085.1 hypothetical protein [Clostridium gasigenes]MBU3138024.1 hypothetical protein [Clostridium gasigenes]
MDFLSEQQLIFTSKKYEPIYRILNKTIDVKYHDLFMLCASIGFKHNRKPSIVEKGREFRSNYLSREQKATAYSIILNDSELGRKINKFEEKEFVLEARKSLEQYAEGGMGILVEEVFKSKWTGEILDENYAEYEVDIISYIYDQSKEVPF